jgi:hypothetical protein
MPCPHFTVMVTYERKLCNSDPLLGNIKYNIQCILCLLVSSYCLIHPPWKWNPASCFPLRKMKPCRFNCSRREGSKQSAVIYRAENNWDCCSWQQWAQSVIKACIGGCGWVDGLISKWQAYRGEGLKEISACGMRWWAARWQCQQMWYLICDTLKKKLQTSACPTVRE